MWSAVQKVEVIPHMAWVGFPSPQKLTFQTPIFSWMTVEEPLCGQATPKSLLSLFIKISYWSLLFIIKGPLIPS